MDRKHGTRMRRQRTTFVSGSWTAEVMLVAGFSICFLPRKKKNDAIYTCTLAIYTSSRLRWVSKVSDISSLV